jgi:hypothetical protein
VAEGQDHALQPGAGHRAELAGLTAASAPALLSLSFGPKERATGAERVPVWLMPGP